MLEIPAVIKVNIELLNALLGVKGRNLNDVIPMKRELIKKNGYTFNAAIALAQVKGATHNKQI